MRIKVKSRNGAVPEAIKSYAEKKVQKLERYFRRLQTVEMEQESERGLHTFELSMHGDGVSLRSQERCSDPYAAVDGVVEKMERQIQRFKNRLRHEHQRPGPVKEAVAEVMSSPTD